MVTLGRIVALAMVEGPEAGLAALDRAEGGDDGGEGSTLADHHRTWAVRAHLLDGVGSPDAASLAFAEAARRTLNGPEQRYLAAKAEALRSTAG
jgi:predicted RNA polymerase sigma factor